MQKRGNSAGEEGSYKASLFTPPDPPDRRKGGSKGEAGAAQQDKLESL
jgi:hypothetical protein